MLFEFKMEGVHHHVAGNIYRKSGSKPKPEYRRSSPYGERVQYDQVVYVHHPQPEARSSSVLPRSAKKSPHKQLGSSSKSKPMIAIALLSFLRRIVSRRLLQALEAIRNARLLSRLPFHHSLRSIPSSSIYRKPTRTPEKIRPFHSADRFSVASAMQWNLKKLVIMTKTKKCIAKVNDIDYEERTTKTYKIRRGLMRLMAFYEAKTQIRREVFKFFHKTKLMYDQVCVGISNNV